MSAVVSNHPGGSLPSDGPPPLPGSSFREERPPVPATSPPDAPPPSPDGPPPSSAALRGIFLSYNSRDAATARALATQLRTLPDTEVFFAPEHLRAGEFWLPRLAAEIAAATGFILFVGEEGIGPWQVQEYYAALDRRVKEPGFQLLVLLLDGKPAPGLPFLNQLHWIVSADPASSATAGRIAVGLSGSGDLPPELWRHTAPYRGLASMTESDSAFFFGRTGETASVLRALAERPDRLPLLLGNSGVGKSSVAQAGVIAALKRQAFPGEAAGAWPHRLGDSRRFAYLTMQPGREPIRALVEAFLRVWGLDPTHASSHSRRQDWVTALKTGTLGLHELLDATAQQLEAAGEGRPPGFVLYVDQGEELYVQSEADERRRFSEALASGLGDDRLLAFMSMRADFFGQLQADTALFGVHDQINVVPLGETALRDVVGRPAALLGARFEDAGLAESLARRAREESAIDAGALPLLSYLLDDMWTAMVTRGDGTLRLPRAAVELGGILAERADAYLKAHPEDANALRRILTLKLATVREDGDPTRRKAARPEFSDQEWRIVGTLADHPHRLLVTAAPAGREPYAEVAHEAIFRHWAQLKEWISAERDFLIWKARVEADRHHWEELPPGAREDALYRGHELAEAERWLAARAEDLAPPDRTFIASATAQERALRESVEQERKAKARLQRALLWTAIVAVVILSGIAFWGESQRGEAVRQSRVAQDRTREVESEKAEAERQKRTAESEKARAERALEAAKDAVDTLVFKLAQELRERGLSFDLRREVLGQAEALVDALVKSDPDDRRVLRLQYAMYWNFADAYASAGDTERASASVARSVASARRVYDFDPTNTRAAFDLSVSLEKTAGILLVRRDFDGAGKAFDEGIAIRRRLVAAQPNDVPMARALAAMLDVQGDILSERGDFDGSLKPYVEGQEIRRGLVAAHPKDAEIVRLAATSLSKIALLERKRGHGADACRALSDGRAMLVPYRGRTGTSKRVLDDLTWFEEEMKRCLLGR